MSTVSQSIARVKFRDKLEFLNPSAEPSFAALLREFAPDSDPAVADLAVATAPQFWRGERVRLLWWRWLRARRRDGRGPLWILAPGRRSRDWIGAALTGGWAPFVRYARNGGRFAAATAKENKQ